MLICLKRLLLVMICICISTAAFAEDHPTLTTGGTGDFGVTVQITGNIALNGTMNNVNDLNLRTKFGQATIPLSEIDGLKLHADENDSCVVAFKNGDIITGQLELAKISVNTHWGDANIRVENIETILTNVKGSFFKDGAQGKTYWRFSETRTIEDPRLSGTSSTRQTRPNTNQNPRGFNVSTPNFNGR